MKKNISWISILILLLCLNANGQDALLIPSENLLKTYYTNIPIASEKLSITAANVYVSQHTGVFSQLRTTEASVVARIKRSRFRLHFENKNEGPVIKYNNGYIAYGVHVALREKLYLAGEFDVGFLSLRLGDMTTSDFSVDSNFDLKLRILLYSEKHYLECKVQHITSPEIQPARYSIKYPVALYGLYAYHFSIDKAITGKVFTSFSRDFNENEFTLGTHFLINKTIALGVAYQTSGDLAMLTDISLLKERKYPIMILFSYELQSLLNTKGYTVPLLHFGISLRKNHKVVN